MKPPGLQILPTALLEDFSKNVSAEELENAFEKLQDAELSNAGFSFYTSVASVYSSKIEGENIELDSYVKHKRFGVQFQPDYTRKIDDLYVAYQFAKDNIPNRDNLSKVHGILAKHIVSENWQGRFRNQNMYVTKDGRIEYVAASSIEVPVEMDEFYSTLDTLVGTDLSITETFFFASLLHLVFVKIHPWNDGNGRTARLLEKWFLANKLGEKAWFVQSEKNYYFHHDLYYQNIRLLGLEYPALEYDKALPFLMMLPQSLTDPAD